MLQVHSTAVLVSRVRDGGGVMKLRQAPRASVHRPGCGVSRITPREFGARRQLTRLSTRSNIHPSDLAQLIRPGSVREKRTRLRASPFTSDEAVVN